MRFEVFIHSFISFHFNTPHITISFLHPSICSHNNNPSQPTIINTLHADAETIRVRYDTNKLTYSDLLSMFFSFHTPENPAWCGSQYRSAIFTFSPEQRKLAEFDIKDWGALGRFVTVEDASDFYRAEEYHQKYLEKWV